MQTVEKCPLCASEHIEKITKHVFKYPGVNVHDHLLDATYVRLWILFERILKNRTDVVFYSSLCNKCGLIFTNPRFSDEDLKTKYDAIIELGSVKYRLQQNPPTNLDTRAKRIYTLVNKHFRSNSGRRPRVLDYGGASGYNLIPFLDTFRCCILDYEKWDLPEGIEYLGPDTSDLYDGEQFDVILLLHTLEHVTEPKAFLAELCTFLKDEGIIYVEVPLGCFREWRSLSEPLTHVNFFSEESLYNCFRFCDLSAIHISTAYQWLIHGKTWCINMLGTKHSHSELTFQAPLLTRKQMNRALYFLPYLYAFVQKWVR
ncbi:class I SAM-dependent methyltransferase [Thermodesulfobacteriota bacterium]